MHQVTRARLVRFGKWAHLRAHGSKHKCAAMDVDQVTRARLGRCTQRVASTAEHPKQRDVAIALPAPQSRAQTGNKMAGDTNRRDTL